MAAVWGCGGGGWQDNLTLELFFKVVADWVGAAEDEDDDEDEGTELGAIEGWDKLSPSVGLDDSNHPPWMAAAQAAQTSLQQGRQLQQRRLGGRDRADSSEEWRFGV